MKLVRLSLKLAEQTYDLEKLHACAVAGQPQVPGTIVVDHDDARFRTARKQQTKARAARLVQPKEPRSKGLGDTIAKITRAVGIKPCDSCKKRQEKLNKLIPYRPPD